MMMDLAFALGTQDGFSELVERLVFLSDSLVDEEGGLGALVVLLEERVVALLDCQGARQPHAPRLALPLLP